MVNADSGDSTHLGGDDWDTLDKYFDDIDISPSVATIRTNTKYRNGKLFFWDAAETYSYNLKTGTLTQNVDLTLPSLSASGTLIASGGANDWGTAVQTFRDDNLKIMNPGNTFGYIFSTSAITTADKTVTLPLLTTNDTFVFNDFTAVLTKKTVNIDTNTLKHSTTNAQGDLYKYDSGSGKIIRVPRGTANQVLKTNSGGTDIEWAAEAGAGSTNVLYDNLKSSSGIKYGLWSGQSATMGYGLLSDIVNISGSSTKYIDTTNGFTGLNWAMTSSSANCGFKNTAVCTIRKLNPDLTVCFQLDEGGDTVGSRVWIGFTGDLSEAANDSQYLDSDIGICMSKASSEDFFRITSNDGDATQDQTASILTTDGNSHTIRIYATEASSKWSYSLDGAAAVDITAEIPGATDQLGVIVHGSQSDSASRNFRVFWAKMLMKERV